MTTARTTHNEKGFTLIETMVALAMFLVICGAIFKLLNSSQQRFQTDSQVLNSFQDARLGLDQIVRDADDAGYPPFSNFSALPAGCNANQPCATLVNSPIAWHPGYVTLTPCQIGTAGGGTCTSPSDFDVIFEENADNTVVKWIRYQLAGTTLFRGVATKSNGNSAWAALNNPNVMLPYITNVMNNASPAQIAKFQATYPSMFPGGNPQPIFQYYCPNSAVAPPLILCQNPGANNAPSNVVDVEVTLIVQTPQVDAQTGAPRLVELNGRGHRINPNQ
ncbi:MAG TPA: prepilin-type N-terminal cleavage/methylation domain-containing protein [Candidatus Acidoferrales bacterium]|nr:prepilin-type N-terminal cleavage/methylation domain-containing protein [Candidatus Acidoferrales bacterium]